MEPRATVLKSSFDLAHMVFNAVVADLDETMAAHRPPGGTVPHALAIIAHALYGEDMMVNQQVRRATTVLESAGFLERTGITTPQPVLTPEWLATSFKLSGLKEYGAAVFEATSAFLSSATAEQLDQMVSTPIGSQVSAAEYLGGFGVVHIAEHTGEVSALKGAQGARGLPF